MTLHVAANVWVSKYWVMTWTAEEGMKREEGRREILQSALPPWGSWQQHRCCCGWGSRGELHSSAWYRVPIAGRELACNRDVVSYHGWLLLPAGNIKDAPEPGNVLLISCIYLLESLGRSFWAGRLNAAVALAVAAGGCSTAVQRELLLRHASGWMKPL